MRGIITKAATMTTQKTRQEEEVGGGRGTLSWGVRKFQQFCLLVIHNPTLVQARYLSLSLCLPVSFTLCMCVCVCGVLGPRCSSFMNGSPLIYCAKRVKPSLPLESQQHFCAALISYSLPQRRDATHSDYDTAQCRAERGSRGRGGCGKEGAER